MTELTLHPQPLTPEHFAPFGHVIALHGHAEPLPHWPINDGHAMRYELLRDLQLQADGGVPMMAIFRAPPRQFPLAITALERHALGSQTFVPLGNKRFLVVVAAPGSAPQADALHAFITDGQQGIVLAPGTWHHALLAVDGGDFVVIERAAAQVDCEVVQLAQPVQVQVQLQGQG
ncbi:MAG: ureidoglycolate lyase [Comamonas sp.]|nr:ureidoglycolate lyase [Candidatus Comamonas equi]